MKRTALTLSLLVLLVSILAIQSCQKTDLPAEFSKRELVLPEEPLDYDVQLNSPLVWQNQIPFSTSGEVNAKATLGRALFYDTRMSFNNTTSCGSCHQAAFGYADNEASSQGMQGLGTRRNSPGIANLVFENEFFWDGRRNDLEVMVLDPVQDHIEMGLSNLDAVMDRLSQIEEYEQLFSDAYFSSEVTEAKVRTALATFIESMVSTNSRYDQHLAGASTLNGQELVGLQLFEQNCMTCHGGVNLGGWGWANIGLEDDYADNGVAEWSGNATLSGAFLIPGLRNVEKTAPYMHDGRFETLEQVVNHYSENIVLHDHLDWRLIDPASFGDIFFPFENQSGWANTEAQPLRMNFNQGERDALVAFLRTMTDQTHLTAERFSDPFVLVD